MLKSEKPKLRILTNIRCSIGFIKKCDLQFDDFCHDIRILKEKINNRNSKNRYEDILEKKDRDFLRFIICEYLGTKDSKLITKGYSVCYKDWKKARILISSGIFIVINRPTVVMCILKDVLTIYWSCEIREEIGFEIIKILCENYRSISRSKRNLVDVRVRRNIFPSRTLMEYTLSLSLKYSFDDWNYGSITEQPSKEELVQSTLSKIKVLVQLGAKVRIPKNIMDDLNKVNGFSEIVKLLVSKKKRRKRRRKRKNHQSGLVRPKMNDGDLSFF